MILISLSVALMTFGDKCFFIRYTFCELGFMFHVARGLFAPRKKFLLTFFLKILGGRRDLRMVFCLPVTGVWVVGTVAFRPISDLNLALEAMVMYQALFLFDCSP